MDAKDTIVSNSFSGNILKREEKQRKKTLLRFNMNFMSNKDCIFQCLRSFYKTNSQTITLPKDVTIRTKISFDM